MSKIGLIIKREYLRRVSKKSFLLLTFLTPFIFAALVFVPLWLSSLKDDKAKQIAVVDNTGKYVSLFKDTQEYTFIIPDGGDMETYRQNSDKEIFAFLNITDDLQKHPEAAAIYSQKQIPLGLKLYVDRTLSEYLKDERLASYHIENLKQIIEDSKVHFDVKTVKWGDDGSEKNTSAEVSSIVGMVLTFVIYMFIIMYGAMVMQGVMEEKTNRIVEIMISSVKPFDLMMGKIIGIGFVGLTQVFLWSILTTVLVSGSLFVFGGNPADVVAASPQAMVAPVTASAEMNSKVVEILNSIDFGMIVSCFVFYFIGGYLLYAALFAAIGSALDQQEDSQQFMTPVMLLMVFSLYAGIYSINNPDGPLAFWCSMIPFTSPIVMMVRLPFDIPVWQLFLSLFLLFATAVAIVWFSAKIYRVGILMYGKKPSIREMIKWLQYK